MADSAQKRALQNYRARLAKRGMARFEVLGLGSDRQLIRSLASRLAEGGPEAERIRTSVDLTIAGDARKKGSVLEALRRSPLVSAQLKLKRSRRAGAGRKVDL